MKFHVTGSNKDTGARMTLDIEAGSKAAAERKATQAGMNVNHCQEVFDQPHEARHSTHRGEFERSRSKAIPICVLLALVGAVAWFFWPQVMG